ncbi:hypothetical protein IVG45_02115 [Methylomonas sp. LL1]|uniref:hypothetical protein n=1 Tax=Methylomonas sp. LL1 TaxID=2785785 RepID=UPI0018C3D84B|nr:hypothetical protein [Methylomonas sp. LL1]QPK63795.1 hypothetical protein IVG45_02115 [Methylomonas sp. LL1]
MKLMAKIRSFEELGYQHFQWTPLQVASSLIRPHFAGTCFGANTSYFGAKHAG